MPVVKNKTTDTNREFWSHVEDVAQQVNTWPDWMRNESHANAGRARECSEQNRERRSETDVSIDSNPRR
jgi:hypothetical protein